MTECVLNKDERPKLYGMYVNFTYGDSLDQAVQAFPLLIGQIRGVMKNNGVKPDDEITFILKPGTFGWKFRVKEVITVDGQRERSPDGGVSGRTAAVPGGQGASGEDL